MTKELGFRTPAKEMEKLKTKLEQVQGLSKYVSDIAILSLWALAEMHSIRAEEHPKICRALKDDLLYGLKGLVTNRDILDTLDAMCKTTCERLEKEGALGWNSL